MAFYIVQHGLSLPKDQDPEKSLSPEGIEKVRSIAQVARDYGVGVNQILHSGKKRAGQTADILAEVLEPARGVQETEGMNPLDDVAEFAPRVDFSVGAMLVGHLPFLERLISYLITGGENPAVFKLQNGGILCLDTFEDTKTPAIKWALMPAVE